MGATSATTKPSHHRVRKMLEKALQGHANYTRLKDTEKTPVRSFKAGKPNRMKRLPQNGNYGVIPQDRLLILDFDDHRAGSWNVEQQIDFFSSFLNLNLRDSLSVITQSGGVHIYLLLPEGIRPEDTATLPKASLRSYNKAFTEMLGYEVNLDADIRTAAVNSYVVGPTSSIRFADKETRYHGYVLANESFGFKNLNFELSTLSSEAFLKLQKISAMRRGVGDGIAAVKKTGNLADIYTTTELVERGLLEKLPTLPAWAEEAEEKNLLHEKPDTVVLSRLKKKLVQDEIKVFHQARAFVKAALHCCYDNYSIALACSALGVDKDSYRKEAISFSLLMRDVSRFKPSVRYHGAYCHKGRKLVVNRPQTLSERGDFDVESFARSRKAWIEQKRAMEPSGIVSPKVLDLGKISKAIKGESRKKGYSQQYFDALSIVNHYIQPLSNVGAYKLLLAYSDISKNLGIPSSRIRQAMRILRDNGIIKIAEKQRTGMAASYVVSEKYHHAFLSKNLKLTWGKFNSDKADNRIDRSIYLDFSDGQYKTVFGDEIVEPIRSIAGIYEDMMEDVPKFERQGAGSASRYLRSEKQMLEEAAELDKEWAAEEEASTNDKKISLDDLVLEDLDEIILPERYEKWDEYNVLDTFSGELRKFDDLILNDSS